MLLAFDIGNTNIVIGVFLKDKLIEKWRLESSATKSADDYAIDIIELFLSKSIDCLKISNVIIASVVPNLIDIIKTATQKIWHGKILVIGENIDPKIKILLKNKDEVGADRLLNALAGFEKFKQELIIVDFGTATTFDVIDKNGSYLGGVIAPGINLSIKALHDMTAKLPIIKVQKQDSVIGKSTKEAMNSGIYFGYIGLIEGLIERIRSEYQSLYDQNHNLEIILTGGLAPLFSKSLKYQTHLDPDLTLYGLYHCYNQNN